MCWYVFFTDLEIVVTATVHIQANAMHGASYSWIQV